MKPYLRIALLLTLIASLAMVAAGCSKSSSGGGSGSASAKKGKTIFKANCGGCHTLADAKTNGNVGPNLDDLKPDKQTVQLQVQSGGGGMPSFKGQLSKKQIDEVATYVSSSAK